MTAKQYLALILILTQCLLGSIAAASTLEQQRKNFVAAEGALKKGQMGRYQQLRKKLQGYALLPYLDFDELTTKLATVSNKQARLFLQSYNNTPLAERFQVRWLNHLARHRRWQSYLDFYSPQRSITRQCHYLNALIHTGQADIALPGVEAIWLHGKSRPRACDPVFRAWEKAGLRTTGLTWKRIRLAMEKGQWRLARYLGKTLDNNDRAWLQRWIDIHRQPKRVLRHQDFQQAHPYREVMLAHTVQRLSRWDSLQAREIWQKIQKRYNFNPLQILLTERRLTRAMVRNTEPEAYRFITNVQPCTHDTLLQEARIRAALLKQDWAQVANWIDQLPAHSRDSERWRYWKARALAETGDANAQQLFEELSRQRSYYGFLAADRVGNDYHLLHAETEIDPDFLQQLVAKPSVRRAYELFALNRWIDARREWRYATGKLSKEQLLSAAKLAQQRGWLDQAIFTLARSGYWDDLELRFPLQHRKLVEKHAGKQQLDKAWVYAVIRQESAFMQDAHSSAGAMGLMQLMPATARHVARSIKGQPTPRKAQLLQPRINIALGSTYLRQMKDKLDDSQILATAAYNAGPHRVKRWLPQDTLPADIWIELIPFKETQGYLKRVLTYTAIYESRLGQKPIRLSKRMRAIKPAPIKVAAR